MKLLQDTKDIRQRVAKEAAILLYRRMAGEYRQAKERAARSLGVKVLPSNFEVAGELDKLAEELEGHSRKERLVVMREEALAVMRTLHDFSPRLIGGVWRGVIHRGSDIDIVAYASDTDAVISFLKSIPGHGPLALEWRTVEIEGQSKRFLHVVFTLESGHEVEVVIRHRSELGRTERCDIYGDLKIGLDIGRLEGLLTTDPLRRFVPESRT